MLKIGVFTVVNVEIWVMLSSNEVDLLVLRNYVFRLRIFQKCAVPSRKGFLVDCLESCILVAKRSDMINYVMKVHLFSDTQESCFEAWKSSHMACSALLCGRFANSQESCFQARNAQICVVLTWKLVVLVIFTKSVFKLQIVQIWTVSK